MLILSRSEEINMAVNYKPLWLLLIEKDLNKTDLTKLANISTNVVAKMGKNEYVSLQTLEKICIVLNCQLSSVVQILK